LGRGGLGEDEFEVCANVDAVQGYIIDRPMRTRDALEPLLAGLGLIAADRDGRVAVGADGTAASAALTVEALALPDEGESLRAERVLERKPGTARVRYIDGDAGYETGAAVVRTAGEGGCVDLDLPAVCSGALARAAAERALLAGGTDRLVVTPGPLQALALEPGDAVTVEGRSGDWRIMRLDRDETPSAVLEPVSVVRVGEDHGRPASGEASRISGAPFLRMMELPPLIGTEGDGRPIVVVASDPWRPMRVFAGVDATALTVRADVARPATVGVLVEALGAGVRHRWDTVNTLRVRIEGRAPESRSDAAVFAGGNAVAIETAAGWELVQFRSATLVGEGVWRLTGLLRGQQGTEALGAARGAVVVVLDQAPARVDSDRAERGLPLIWRAGAAGGPAGGSGVSEVGFTITGLYERPWSPAHLRVRVRLDGGFDLGWVARARIDGDNWEGEALASGSPRFRIRVLDGADEKRAFEVGTDAATYTAADRAVDFPAGLDGWSRIAVAQWGDGYGWGREASVVLTA
ncbi:MAG: phage tail protein, partial [bacterium]